MNYLEIEWRHLDKNGKTCDRCSKTGESVRTACKDLAEELKAQGWEVHFKETLLTEQKIPESNSIYFNGIAIEDLLSNTLKSENSCDSCGELLNKPTCNCRTLERDGQTFEAIPYEMILEAAHRFIERQNKPNTSVKEIKVLGPGCFKCQKTEEIIREAVVESKASANVEKITDIVEIASYGALTTPAVIVDGEVKSVGRIPDKKDIKSWIQN